MNRYTFSQAHRLVPLLASVAREIHELREERSGVAALAADLEGAARTSPEGLAVARDEARNRLAQLAEGLRRCLHELFRLGVYVARTNPLVLHIPGLLRGRNVTFGWQEGEGEVVVLEAPGSGFLPAGREVPTRP